MGSHGGPKIVRDRLKLLLDGRDEGLRGGKSTLTDGSGNSNSGSMYTGIALNFDGSNDYINTNATFQSTFRDSWSWECWIKPTEGHDSAGPDLMGSRNSTYEDWVHVEVYSDGTIAMYYASDGDGQYARTSAVIFTSGVNDWHHIVAVADNTASQMYIYVNGVLQNLQPGSWDGDMTGITMGDFTTTDNMYIAARNKYTSAGAEEHFNGKMSGFKLFSTALSAANVSELYNNPNKVLPSGVSSSKLAGWWPLSEGSGTIAYDGSGNNNHGALTNGPNYVSSQPIIPQLAGKGLSTKAVFDGSNDYVTNSSFTTWDVADKWTVSWWMYMTSTALQTFFSLQESGDANNKIEIITNNGAREIFINNNDGGGQYNQCDTNNNAWSTSEWTNIVVTNDGGTDNGSNLDSVYSIYINGVSQSINSLGGSVGTVMTNSSRKLMIGTQVPLGRYVGGILDEVAMWNTDLDSDAVSTIYNSGQPLDVRDNHILYDEYTDNLVGYWRNNGTIDWKDLSGKNHDLSSSGSPAIIKSPEGKIPGMDSHGMFLSEPNAGIFDGSANRIEVADSNTLDQLAEDFTVEVWLKSQGPISSHESPLSRYIVSGEPGIYMYINYTTGYPYIRFNDSVNSEIAIPISTDIRNDNIWHHCVWSFDRSSNCLAYHNGSLSTTTSISSRNASCDISQVLQIGSNSSESQNWLGGISGVKYYIKALSAGEVLQNYNMHKSRFG